MLMRLIPFSVKHVGIRGKTEDGKMEVQPVEWDVQPLFYRPKSDRHSEISFDGVKWYTFKRVVLCPYSYIKKFDYIILYTDNNMIKCDGYYDRDEGLIFFFKNPNIYKLHRGIIRRQKLERLKQSFLVSIEQRRRSEKMGKLDVMTTDEIPSPEAGKTYTVKDVEEFTSAVRGFKGLRVTLVGKMGVEHIESLWIRDIVGPNSKLGSFIVLLGKNTDKWVGKVVKFVKWSEGKRELAKGK